MNKVLNIATVFSGIGAAEQALKQIGIEHEIIFACDNGERYLKQSEEEIRQYLDGFPVEETPCRGCSSVSRKRGVESDEFHQVGKDADAPQLSMICEGEKPKILPKK